MGECLLQLGTYSGSVRSPGWECLRLGTYSVYVGAPVGRMSSPVGRMSLPVGNL